MRLDKLSRRSLLLLSLGGLVAGCSYVAAAKADGTYPGQPGVLDAVGANLQAEKNMANDIPTTPVQAPEGKEIATLAAGCFWCVEAIFLNLKGVEKVVSGYSGGRVANPSYEEVCTGTTDHAEVIQIVFDPKVISFADILHVFFTTHDPTTLNRQGADVGTQYRSAIFYHSPEQKAAAEKVVQEITAEKLYPHPIVTEVTEFKNFYAAENYHQNYYARNPNQGYCSIVIAPKVRKFREKYRHLLKQ